MFKKNVEPTMLEKELKSLFIRLDYHEPHSDDYAKIIDQIVKLTKLKEETLSKSRVSADTMAVIAANLTGIILIIGHERVGIITSKALSFVMKK